MADCAIEHSAATRPEAEAAGIRLPVLGLTSAQRTALWLIATIGIVFAVQAPALGHYFFNDDFVPLADIATRSTSGYIKDVFLLRDLTPNWRFLTGLVYLAEYRAFHLHAMPYVAVNVLVHTATSGLVFWLVRGTTNEDWPAIFAGALFGVAAATVPTVGQITALNNVLAAFFVTLTLVLLIEALNREHANMAIFLAAIVTYAGAIASNESTLVVAPVMALVVLWKAPRGETWWKRPGEWLRAFLFSAPFIALGSAALIGFGTCGCTEAELYSRDNIVDNVWLYFGRLAYPIGLDFPGHAGTAHQIAGVAVVALAVLALVRGPALARISVAFLFLATAPYLPIALWSATRYTYLASVPFAIIVSLLSWDLAKLVTRLNPALMPLIAVAAVAAIAFNGWQTLSQNADQADASDEWRQLLTALDATYPYLPAGSTVYVGGWPATNEYQQCAVMPAIGEVLWGNAKLFTLPPEKLTSYRARPGYSVYVGDFADGRVVPQALTVATDADLQNSRIFLLPHVPPTVHGNICRKDVPTFP